MSTGSKSSSESHVLSKTFLDKMTPRGDFYDQLENTGLWELLDQRFVEFLKLPPNAAPKIPRAIHQIWLGGPLPERYRRWSQKWKDIHPNWEYHLWNESSILADDAVNEEAFRKTVNLGAKSDIARYAILKKYGGFYADTDFEPVRPLDPLLRCSFVSGIVYEKAPETNNAFFGTVPHHPIIEELVEETSKPLLWNDGGTVMDFSGPWAFSRAVFRHFQNDPGCVVLPHAYLYPYPNRSIIPGQSLASPESYIRSETLAYHHWDKGWLKGPTLWERLVRKLLRLVHRFYPIKGIGRL